MIFSEFMAYALYDQADGYYTKKANIFGEKGDFITAPLVSPLFSITLAKQIAEILSALPVADVLELGPGTGAMAAHSLLTLEKLNCLPRHYYLFEVSEPLKKQQQETLQHLCPHLCARCIWLQTLPTAPFYGVIVGNEFLDALPVERFLFQDGAFLQSHVTFEQGTWHETFQKSTDTHFLKAIDSIQASLSSPFINGYLSEVAPAVNEMVALLSQILTQGALLFIDYGFGAREYYHPDRKTGTLMCHYQQQAHPNPFVHVGAQDITAHVNFTEVAKIAVQNGCELGGYTTQAHFLTALGILEAVDTPHEQAPFSAAQALKKLLLPHEMGELFKVIGLTKLWHNPLRGFMHSHERSL